MSPLSEKNHSLQAMIEGMTVDGKIYALPYDAEPDVMFYNRRLFTEAGLGLPPTTYTYEKFLSDMKKLTSGDMAGIKRNGILGQLLRDSWLAFTEGLL